MGDSEVLAEVLNRIERAHERVQSESGIRPVLLLDLDSTLYEVGPRTHHILLEWSETAQAREFYKVREALLKAESSHVGYSIGDTFGAIGLDVNDELVLQAQHEVKLFWADRFFSNEYLKHDHAYPGAASFTQKAHELGAEVIYLTGRDEPRMGDGTRENLVRDLFPWNTPRTHLLMKPRAELPDLEHKVNAQTYIRSRGGLIASFENEPPNVVALSQIFPEAMHVFVETVFSDHPALPQDGLYRIQGFQG